MMVRAHFNARIENMESTFLPADSEFYTFPAVDSMTNDVSLRRFDVILAPRFEYNAGERFKISLDLPLNVRLISYADEQEHRFHFLPRLSLSGDIAGGLRYNFDARLTSGVGGVNSLYMGYLMTNYRSIGRRSGQLLHSSGKTATAGLAWHLVA